MFRKYYWFALAVISHQYIFIQPRVYKYAGNLNIAYYYNYNISKIVECNSYVSLKWRFKHNTAKYDLLHHSTQLAGPTVPSLVTRTTSFTHGATRTLSVGTGTGLDLSVRRWLALHSNWSGGRTRSSHLWFRSAVRLINSLLYPTRNCKKQSGRNQVLIFLWSQITRIMWL